MGFVNLSSDRSIRMLSVLASKFCRHEHWAVYAVLAMDTCSVSGHTKRISRSPGSQTRNAESPDLPLLAPIDHGLVCLVTYLVFQPSIAHTPQFAGLHKL